MRKIKFRGKTPKGKIVFGDLIHYPNVVCIKHIRGLISTDYEVDPESVAQFLGYDKNGREIYEGDDLECDIGLISEAKIYVGLCLDDFDIGAKFDWYKFVE